MYVHVHVVHVHVVHLHVHTRVCVCVCVCGVCMCVWCVCVCVMWDIPLARQGACDCSGVIPAGAPYALCLPECLFSSLSRRRKREPCLKATFLNSRFLVVGVFGVLSKE